MKKKMSRTLAVLMCLMTAVAFMPTFAFAEDGAAITVYLTVSNEGSLAKANDGSAMAWKEVKVKDTDNDSHYSFDEALTAAHEAYNSVDNYGAKEDSVSKLWGVSTTNVWFSVNGKGLKSGVSSDDVQDGDYITAQINTDNELYSDWYSEFDKKTVTVKEGESVSLNLSGYQGSTAYMDDALKKIKGASVGVWNGGSMTGAKATDDNGDVSLSFDKAGTYVVTAKGVVPATVDASLTWTLMESSRDKDDKTIYGKMDWTTYDSFIGYTEKDYGEGPYPWNEIQWVDLTEFDAASWDYDNNHLLYSGNVIRECPIMAPACVVTVRDDGTVAPSKVEAIKTLTESYDINKYRSIVHLSLLSQVVAGVAEINSAGTPEEVNAALEKALDKVGAIKTDAQMTADENAVKAIKVSLVSVKAGKKKATVKWKRNTTFSGYQIYYKQSGKKAKYTYASSTASSKTIKSLKKGKKYTFKVRGYKKMNGKTIYSSKWSSSKTVRIK